MNPVARTEAILTESVGNELIVYDEQAQKAHRLNPTSAFVWRNCDGTRTTADLAKLLHREMGIPEDEGFVSLALELLEKQRLVRVPFSADTISRRDAIRRLKALGVVAAMIPVVATIASPPAAAAVSRKIKVTTDTTDPIAPVRSRDPLETGQTGGTGEVNSGNSGSGPYRLAPWH
jgi:hypothetical protein